MNQIEITIRKDMQEALIKEAKRIGLEIEFGEKNEFMEPSDFFCYRIIRYRNPSELYHLGLLCASVYAENSISKTV